MLDNLNNVTAPILALILWTFVMWFWMYMTRIPAMRAAGIDPANVKGKEDFARLPRHVNWIADNYNHLHEQPTVFYALAVYTHLAGVTDAISVALCWIYVGIRVVHSLVQATSNFVPVRFYIFAAGSLALMILTGRNVYALMAY